MKNAAVVFASGILLFAGVGALQAAERPNVLFIAVDDLRPQLSCYGKQLMHTPNFDRLAARGVVFERAYCMVPTCGASRASLFTGIRPTPRRFVQYTARADQEAPQAVTLNSWFKQHGYTTISLGKILHVPADSEEGWSEKPWRAKGMDYQNRGAMRAAIAEHQRKYPSRKEVRGLPYEAADAPDGDYRDGQNTEQAIRKLRELSGQSDSPFFLAVGFHKPHLPFTAPQKYWDLYDPEQIHLPDNYGPPKGAPEGAVHSSGELRAYATIPPSGPVNTQTALRMIHGYYACVSFIDAQLGRLLDTLDELQLSDNTIVILWGDHGWQLGEHGMWNKHSCFETSMHAPLMIVVPGQKEVKPGTRVKALTEFIDIYPSLCELTGIEAPEHLEGTSFVPLLRDPSLPGKPFAVGRFGSGDTIRSDLHRYSEYRRDRGRGPLTGRMLYDHRGDPDENLNVVDAVEQAADVTELARELRERKGHGGPRSSNR